MTRDALLKALIASRALLDEKLAAVPRDRMDVPVPGSTHSVKDILAHLSMYEQLVVKRLVASRRGLTTDFDRDREGWEKFNERTWAEAAGRTVDDVLEGAAHTLSGLVCEIEKLTDAELAAPVGATAALDPAWLEDLSPGELIVIDTTDHYPMHYAALDAMSAPHEA